ncbi:MAG: hypothetical protein AAGK93_03555 [Pseudomonadota bacterium]
MTESTAEAIHQAYRQAKREHLMNHLRHEAEYDRFNAIEAEARQRVADEKQDWQDSYYGRLAEAREIILRETYGDKLQTPKPEDMRPAPDRQALDVKADQRIRADHHKRLTAIRQDELDQYEELRDVIRKRDRLKDFAKAEFTQARKRSGPSRS